ncbi:DUF3558 domain-containing protein [Actinophytocola sp.]|uniref:DUF3558 domain-containing protein n=1 Tax=Actinophytocola sp. TaxID=1872138 RepID=UPI002D80BCAD|nr:DUF3558 domain-containing protein [Actinophytocola sp.]HET9143230.1 DUF3558 domain-containing protein [Actinophytocola sp.]
MIASILLVGGLVAGCTNTSAGQPLPTADGPATSGTQPSPPSGSTTSGSAPARPREIRLDGKDPCALVPQSDWPKFYIEKPGRLRRQDPVFKSPDCFYSNNVLGLSITLVMTEGIGGWTDGSKSGIAKNVEPVEGFPAIAITRKGDQYDCYVAVDTANGQYLLATVNLTPSKASQVPERCEYAHQLAESAMRTLVGGG